MWLQPSQSRACSSTRAWGTSTRRYLTKLLMNSRWQYSTSWRWGLLRPTAPSDSDSPLQNVNSSSRSQLLVSSRSIRQPNMLLAWMKQSSDSSTCPRRQASRSTMLGSAPVAPHSCSLNCLRNSTRKNRQALSMWHSLGVRRRPSSELYRSVAAYRRRGPSWLPSLSSSPPSFRSSSWMPQVWLTLRRAFCTLERMAGEVHCTQPVSVPLPALPAICWISCSSSSCSTPFLVLRWRETKTTLEMLRLRPIPMALVATRQGSRPSLKATACARRTSEGSFPYTIAVLFSTLPSPSSSFPASAWPDCCWASMALMSLRWRTSASLLKLMTVSPGAMFFSSNGLWIRLSLLSREYLRSSSRSPVSSRILLTTPRARSSPQRWMRLARRVRMALVQAQPRSSSAIIWISSTTATSQSSVRGAASMVQLTRLLLLYCFSWPVMRSQPPSFCWYSQASSRNGAMQMPFCCCDSPFSSSTAAVDFPELVGPWWYTNTRRSVPSCFTWNHLSGRLNRHISIVRSLSSRANPDSPVSPISQLRNPSSMPLPPRSPTNPTSSPHSKG